MTDGTTVPWPLPQGACIVTRGTRGKCNACGRQFQRYTSAHIYCSRKCMRNQRYDYTEMSYSCQRCGVAVLVTRQQRPHRPCRIQNKWCKACRVELRNERNRKRLREQRAADPRRFAEYQRRNYARHRLARIAASKRWLAANPEKRRAIASRWCERHPEQRLVSSFLHRVRKEVGPGQEELIEMLLWAWKAKRLIATHDANG